jgi:hypothetical protein
LFFELSKDSLNSVEFGGAQVDGAPEEVTKDAHNNIHRKRNGLNILHTEMVLLVDGCDFYCHE